MLLLKLLLRLFLRLFPWIILVVIGIIAWSNKSLWFFGDEEEGQPKEEIIHNVVLQKVEALGKLELVKYNFQDITELTEKNKDYLGIFPSGESKAILISHGEAVGCIDLTKLKPADLMVNEDSLVIKIPEPELCYYKLDLGKTRLYAIEKGVYYKDENKIIEKAYRNAENEIRNTALKSGLLEQTRKNAEIFLRPILEEISGKKVYFTREYTMEYLK